MTTTTTTMDEEEEASFWEEWADDDEPDVIDEDEMERQKLADLAKLEEELREDAGDSFEGPFGEKSTKSPFLSFRRDTDEEDEE